MHGIYELFRCHLAPSWRRYGEPLYTVRLIANPVQETYYPVPVMMTPEDFQETSGKKSVITSGKGGECSEKEPQETTR